MPIGARSLIDRAATAQHQSIVTKQELGTHSHHIFRVFSGGAQDLDFYVKHSDFKRLARFFFFFKGRQNKTCLGPYLSLGCQFVNLVLCPDPRTMDDHLPYICITIGAIAKN